MKRRFKMSFSQRFFFQPKNFLDRVFRRRDRGGILVLAAGLSTLIYRYIFYPPVLPDEIVRFYHLHRYNYWDLSHLGALDIRVHDPYLFLAGVKLLTSFLPQHEYALRLLPFLCAVFSLLAFGKVKDRFLGPVAANVAFGLLAVCPTFIYYSCRLMPYCADILMTIIWLYVFQRWAVAKAWSSKGLVFCGVAGMLTVWFSLPAVFVLSGGGLALMLEAALQRRFQQSRRMMAVWSLWLVGFGVYYFHAIRYFTNKDFLREVWQEHLVPRAASLGEVIGWLTGHVYRLFENPAHVNPLLGGALLISGALIMLRRQRAQALILLMPLVMTILAALWGKYPLHGRVLSFLLPILFIVIAYGWEKLFYVKKNWMESMLRWLIILLLFWPPVQKTWQEIHKSYERYGLLPVMEHIGEHLQPGDGMYVLYQGHWQFNFFRSRFRFDPKIVVQGTCSDSFAQCVDDFKMLRPFRRVWFILFPHESPDRSSLRYVPFIAEKVGKEVGRKRSGRCYAYLYELDAEKMQQITVDFMP